MTISVRKILPILLFTFTLSAVNAQRKSDVKKQIEPKKVSKPKQQEDEERVKSKLFSYGVTTNTNSGLLGGFVVRHSQEIERSKSGAVHRYVALEVVNIKHPKEKTLSSMLERVILGKTNYLFNFRPEYGREFMLFGSTTDDKIGISGIVAVGPSLGIQKPYYIKYLNDAENGTTNVQYDPNIQKDINRIVGSANMWHAMFTNLKFVPGFHIKLATNIDMNTFGEKVTGIEIGFTADYFFKRPEIMSSQLAKNAQIYTGGYLTLYLGNKNKKK